MILSISISTPMWLHFVWPAFCAMGLIPTLGHAEEWSRFRGPNGSGIAEASHLPATIDAGNTVWRVDIGRGISSPVGWEGKLFLTSETNPGQRAIICLDSRDGKELWRYECAFTAYHMHNFNSFASSTPFVDAQRVYVNWASGDSVEALALDHDGKLLWRNSAVANYVHEHGWGASAVVSDGVMIVRDEFETEKEGNALGTPQQMTWKSSVLGLDATTGTQKWKLQVLNTLSPYSTPIVRETGGKHEFILVDSASGVMGIDAATGTMNWQHNSCYKQRSIGSYVLQNDMFFATFGSGDGGKESVLLKLGGIEPLEMEAKIIKNIPYIPTPLLMGDRLYLLRDGGILTCMKFPSGEQVYSERLTASGNNGKRRSTKYFASPVAADGKIYCASQTGDVIVVKPGDTFEVLGANSLDGPITATPAIAWNHLFVRTDKSLWCIGN